MKTSEKVLLGVLAVGVPVGLYLLTRPKPPVVGLGFGGFRSEVRNQSQTTTRQSDGVSGYDFWYYPLIDLTADVSGDYTVVWRYINSINGSVDYDSGDITNVFTGLSAGQTVRLELRDTRPGDPGGVPGPRDTLRGEAIAHGDPEGLFDGAWHAFRSDVNVLASSPSGAVASTDGVLQESFMSVGALAVSFVGFNSVVT